MANIVENRDLNTGGHIKRTSDCIKKYLFRKLKKVDYIAMRMNFYNNVITAAPLHDFGKIAIPDSILNKHGKFTDDEYNIMKLHPIKGAKIVGEILQSSEDEYFRRIAVNIAYYHHEKYDGSGYPSKLKGEEIPFEARIMALADVFDALVSKRCYKEKYSYEKAFNIISESLGTHFDPTLGKIFLNCRDDLITYYDKVSD
ncbi:MAG: HD domain-containing protein [Clostridium sp.]|nr:MAG: HD domain-containing protein [Clostridium sp.]